MSLVKKSSALSFTAAVLTFHSALILPTYAQARGFGGRPVSPTTVTTTAVAPVNALATVGPGVTVTQASANAPVVVTGLTAAQEATMANTLAAWGGGTTATPAAPSVTQQITSAVSTASGVVTTPLSTAATSVTTAAVTPAATSATSSVAAAITSTVTAAATSEAATVAAWGSYNPMTGTPGTSTYAPPAGTVVTPATANPLTVADNGSALSPSMQAGIAASLASSLANFNPTTYVADSPMAKQTALIGMLNSGNYSGAFTYAKANGLLPNLESATGLQQLSSPLDQDSLDFTTLPTLNPFSQSQMEAYYAAAQAAIQNGTLGTGPIEGNCVSGNSNGTINVGCAVTDTATQSNYMWIPPTAAEADANAAHSTLPNLLGFSAAGQQLPSGDPLALTLIIGAFVGVATAGIGEVVGDAIAAGAGVASSAATTVVGSAIVGAADGAATTAAEGGNIGKGALGGLFAGALGGAAQASGVTGDISSSLQNIGVNPTVANVGAGIATSTGTGTILNGGNVGAAFEGAAENGGISAAEGALSDTSTNSENGSMGLQASQSGTAAYLANNPTPNGLTINDNSDASTTAAIAGVGLQTSGFSLDGTSAAIAQDNELDPVVTTAQKLPVTTTPSSGSGSNSLQPVTVTAQPIPTTDFAAANGIPGASGTTVSSGGALSSNVSSLIGTSAATLSAFGATTGELANNFSTWLSGGPQATSVTGQTLQEYMAAANETKDLFGNYNDPNIISSDDITLSGQRIGGGTGVTKVLTGTYDGDSVVLKPVAGPGYGSEADVSALLYDAGLPVPYRGVTTIGNTAYLVSDNISGVVFKASGGYDPNTGIYHSDPNFVVDSGQDMLAQWNAMDSVTQDTYAQVESAINGIKNLGFAPSDFQFILDAQGNIHIIDTPYQTQTFAHNAAALLQIDDAGKVNTALSDLSGVPIQDDLRVPVTTTPSSPSVALWDSATDSLAGLSNRAAYYLSALGNASIVTDGIAAGQGALLTTAQTAALVSGGTAVSAGGAAVAAGTALGTAFGGAALYGSYLAGDAVGTGIYQAVGQTDTFKNVTDPIFQGYDTAVNSTINNSTFQTVTDPIFNVVSTVADGVDRLSDSFGKWWKGDKR